MGLKELGSVRRIFVGSTKRWVMLQSISWLQFGGFIFFSLVVYYGYVLYRFYGQEVLGLVARLKDGRAGERGEQVEKADGKVAEVKVGMAGKGSNGEDGKRKAGEPVAVEQKADERVAAEQEVGHGPGLSGEGQGVMFEEAAAEKPEPEMFKVMEKVVALLRAVLNEGAATGVRREELEDRIQQVLVKYRHLLRTPYARTINHFITRACMTQFSLALTAADMHRLWGSAGNGAKRNDAGDD
jgi:hypothetical protein